MQITTQSPITSGRVGSFYVTALQATGGSPPYLWSVSSGSLPTGMNLSQGGILSGTPSTAGTYAFSATVTDSEHPTAMMVAALSITTAPALQITTTALPNTSPGVTYNATLSATGGFPPYRWSMTAGNLPGGLTLNAATGVISGTPTTAGTSTLTVQASDTGPPLPSVTTSFGINVNAAPPRNAALFICYPAGAVEQINSDGSVTGLPPRPGIYADAGAVPSPNLPLVFAILGGYLQAFLLNPDYSTTMISSATFPTSAGWVQAVDPSGSNLYVLGKVVAGQSSPGNTIPGVSVFTANAYPQPVGGTAVPDVIGQSSSLVFTPDGSFGFLSTCNNSTGSKVSMFFRASDGLLTAGPSYTLSGGPCPGMVAVSPDGKYLATEEIQIYSIASDGSLSTVLPAPFTATYGQIEPGGNGPINPTGIVWDPSGSYLLVSSDSSGYPGGIAVLNFSAATLTQTYHPADNFGVYLYPHLVGTFVYGRGHTFRPDFGGIAGYSLQNGQLTPVPGSPYLGGGFFETIVIY